MKGKLKWKKKQIGEFTKKITENILKYIHIPKKLWKKVQREQEPETTEEEGERTMLWAFHGKEEGLL